jgi:serine/threonine protein kinase
MVLHRDLKPANLLIGGIHAAPDNTSYVGARYGMVKVADFGLSRVTTLLKADLTPATVGFPVPAPVPSARN